MQTNIAKALEDVSDIKQTLENSKVHYFGLYAMSILLGIYHMLNAAMTFLDIYHSAAITVTTIARTLLTVLLIAGYRYIYRKEKGYGNKYYLSLLNIWAVLGIGVPVMTLLINLTSLFYGTSSYAQHDYNAFSNVLLFSVFLIVCAYILGKKQFIFCSLCILFLYMLLNTVLWDKGIPFPFPMSPDARLTFSSLYNLFVVYGGYLILGIFLYFKARKTA